MMIKLILDAQEVETKADELLIDLLLRQEFKIPCVCYHHQLGPIQTCDTCMVEVNGQLGARVRHEGCRRHAGADEVRPGRRRAAGSVRPDAQATTCFTARSATTTTAIARSTTRRRCWRWSTRRSRSRRSRTRSTPRIPFIATIPTSAFFAAAASRPARTSRSTRRSPSTGRIRIRACLWDGGKPIGESSCVSCGHCVTVCPCNALMEKSMLGRGGLSDRHAEDAPSTA